MKKSTTFFLLALICFGISLVGIIHIYFGSWHGDHVASYKWPAVIFLVGFLFRFIGDKTS